MNNLGDAGIKILMQNFEFNNIKSLNLCIFLIFNNKKLKIK